MFLGFRKGLAASGLGLCDIQTPKSQNHGISPIHGQKIMTPYTSLPFVQIKLQLKINGTFLFVTET